MPHRFVTRCIEANGDDINEMVDMPLKTTMTNGYFIEKLAPKLGIDKEVLGMLGYDTKKFFAGDWAMNCARSFYQGIPCLYVQHSRIEHVFVDVDDVHLVLSKDGANQRQIRISGLRDDLEDMIEERKPSSPRDYYALATAFYKEHKDDLDSNRIPLSTFAAHHCDYDKAFAQFDKTHYGKESEQEAQPSR
jgi:hypothetical protein